MLAIAATALFAHTWSIQHIQQPVTVQALKPEPQAVTLKD
jgi:hypothetical protein